MRISDWSSDVCSSDLRPIWAARSQAWAVAGGGWHTAPAASGRRGESAGDDRRRRSDQCRRRDRKSVVQGKSVSVRVDLGGRRIIKKKRDIKRITRLVSNKQDTTNKRSELMTTH